MQYFQNIFILLGALNVTVWFKHKNIVFIYSLSVPKGCQNLGRLNRKLSEVLTLSNTAGPRSAVGNVSGYRCVSDCRSRGREFDPGPVPYFRGDWSWNYFYGHSPPFRWFIQEGLLSVTSESMCTNYWLTAWSKPAQEKVWLGELTVPQWP